MRKAVIALIFVLLFAFNSSSVSTAAQTASSSNVFRFNVWEEVDTLDPSQVSSEGIASIERGLFEGLTKLNQYGRTVPAGAKSWDISADRKVYTFHLRGDSRWSDGTPVKASDYEFAWKRALDPDIDAPYCYLLYDIENAYKYNQGTIIDAKKIGIKAIDDKTLQVRLYHPAYYFIDQLFQPVFYPLKKEKVQGDQIWGLTIKNFVSNGPFALTQWKDNQSVTLSKNKYYYDAKNISFNRIAIHQVEDKDLELAMYKKNQIDFSQNLLDDYPEMQSSFGKDVHVTDLASTYFYIFNLSKPPFDNLNIRKAFQLAVDEDKFKELIGERAHSVVPNGIFGAAKTFREEYDMNGVQSDLEEAQGLLADGLEEEGLTAPRIHPD